VHLKKRIGCLHAHYSNIDYIEQAFNSFHEIELEHFVDPGLIQHVAKGTSGLSLKVKEQVEWIASCNVDAILITCTNYIALLKEEELSLSLPIIKIDEPFFQSLCEVTQPQIILFTNPATVEGTMERLYQYAKLHDKAINVQAKVIDNTFELIMQGKKQAYNNAIMQYFREIMGEGRLISVAQLSMVEAAQQFEKEFEIPIIHPLKSLVGFVMK
jgi:Asp/Glu/hydantoin racemase